MTIKTTMMNSILYISLIILSTMTTAFYSNNQALADDSTSSKTLEAITVYKTPSCGCCGNWISHLENNGFKVNAINQNDLSSLKAQLGIAPNVQACHTAKIGNYFVEGHVPASDIKKMLATKPDIKGITVPGMPMGSPGMEGSRKDNYNVLAINKDKSVTVFNSH